MNTTLKHRSETHSLFPHLTHKRLSSIAPIYSKFWFFHPFCPKTENFLAPPNRIFIAQSKQISAPNTKFFAPKLSLKQLLHPRVGKPVWTTDHDSCIWLICLYLICPARWFFELIWNWGWTDRGLPTLSLKHAWELVGLPVCLRLTHFPSHRPQAVGLGAAPQPQRQWAHISPPTTPSPTAPQAVGLWLSPTHFSPFILNSCQVLPPRSHAHGK